MYVHPLTDTINALTDSISCFFGSPHAVLCVVIVNQTRGSQSEHFISLSQGPTGEKQQQSFTACSAITSWPSYKQTTGLILNQQVNQGPLSIYSYIPMQNALQPNTVAARWLKMRYRNLGNVRC